MELMSSKGARFNLTFDWDKPEHCAVALALTRQGRKKSDYIAELYRENTELKAALENESSFIQRVVNAIAESGMTFARSGATSTEETLPGPIDFGDADALIAEIAGNMEEMFG